METATKRGVTFGYVNPDNSEDADFACSRALVVGINDYANGIPNLTTAVNDAKRLAEILTDDHGYEVKLLTDGVTRERLIHLLEQKIRPSADDRVLFYFAGHGIALDGDDGPQGYLVLQDARADDRDSLLPMTALHDTLSGLPCRHLLAILDCCFAGAFRWSGATRDIPRRLGLLHRERYERYVRHHAWQVLTSAAFDQQALDVLSGKVLGQHGAAHRHHSPFAQALFDGLLGAADLVPARGDGIVTATELYLYLRQRVEESAEDLHHHDQTPGIWPLRRHDKGEYVFLVPGKTPELPPAPELTDAANPYRGLEPYEAVHAPLFFGRSAMTARLAELVKKEPLVIVVGVSGSGKSSLVNAGLIPLLTTANQSRGPKEETDAGKDAAWRVLGPMRPGNTPLTSLTELFEEQLPATGWQSPKRHANLSPLVSDWLRTNPTVRLLLVVDQLEEVITQCHGKDRCQQFMEQLFDLVAAVPGRMHIVLTLRLDFEPLVREMCTGGHWTDQRRFIVTPMSNDELREAIERPATERVLYFEPPTLVQHLIDDVQQTPAALPLVSFTLSELYRLRDPENRALTEDTYNDLGGIVGSLRRRADEEFEDLESAAQATMRRLMLRMVVSEGGEWTRRRAFQSELRFGDAQENARVDAVLPKLGQARLIVSGNAENSWGEVEAYWEPAHDKLLVAWDRLREWYGEAAETLPLVRRVSQAAGDWDREHDRRKKAGLLWHDNPRLSDARNLLLDDSVVPSATGGAPGPKVPPSGGWGSGIANFLRFLFPSLVFPEDRFVLNRLEARFVAESLRYRRNRLRTTTASITSTIVILIGIAGLANVQRLAAERQERMAIARSQVSEAELYKGDDPIRALLLSAQAVKRPFEADDVQLGRPMTLLRELISATGGISLGWGPVSEVDPNRRWLATADERGYIRLWDLGNPVAPPTKLPWHVREDTRPTFDPKGRWIAMVDEQGTAHLWSLLSPRLDSIDLPGEAGTRLIFDPEGRWLAGVNGDTEWHLWDLQQDHPVPQRPKGTWHRISTVTFDPLGHWLSMVDDKEIMRLWDLRATSALAKDPKELGGVRGEPIFSPNGRWLAAKTNNGVRLLDMRKLQSGFVPLKENPKLAIGLAFDPQGRWLAVEELDGAKLWSIQSPARRPEQLGKVQFRFAPNGHWLATVGEDGAVGLWNLQKNRPTLTPLDENGYRELSFDERGDWLIAGTEKGAVRIWNAEQPKEHLLDLQGCAIEVGALAIDSQRGWLVAATRGDTDTACLWNLKHPEAFPYTLRGLGQGIDEIAFDPDGHSLAIISTCGVSRLWVLKGTAFEPMVLHGGRQSWIDKLAFDPLGQWIAAPGGQGVVNLWDTRHLEAEPRPLKGHWGEVSTIDFDATGRWLATGDKGTVHIWDTQHPESEAGVLPGHEDGVRVVAFHPNGSWVTTVDQLGTARRWVWEKWPAEAHSLFPPGLRVSEKAIDGQGRWLATTDEGGAATLWDAQRGYADPRIQGEHQQIMKKMMIDPLGRLLYALDINGEVRYWNLDTANTQPNLLPSPKDGFEFMALGPNGRWIAAWNRETAPWVWDSQNLPAPPIKLIGNVRGIGSLASDLKGRWLVGWGGREGETESARLWDLWHPEVEPQVFGDHRAGIWSAAFDPLGRWLATGSFDGTVSLWHLDSNVLLRTACEVAGRNLTPREWRENASEALPQVTCPQFASGADLANAKVEEQAAAPDCPTSPPRPAP